MAEKIQQSLLFVFIILSLLSAILYKPESHFLLSLVLLGIGFLVLLRFLTLYIGDGEKKSKLSLPQKLLKNLKEERASHNQTVIKRIGEPDFIIWCFAVVLFMLWLFICTIYPAPIQAIKTIHLEFAAFLYDFYATEGMSELSTLTKIISSSLISLMAILGTFLIFSYAYSRSFVRFIYIVFLPIFLILLGTTAFTSGLVSFFVWPDAQFWRGGGVDTARKIFLLHSNIAFDSGSFFLARFIETGFIGAYLFYLLIFPPLIVFFRVLTVRRRRVVPAYIGLGAITLLIMVDLFWIYTPVVNGVFLTGWVLIACSWALSGYKTSCLKR